LCALPFSLPASELYSSPDVTLLAQSALPAIVYIAVESSPFDQYHGPTSYYTPFRSLYEYFWPTSWRGGSGFLITPEGHIVTNAHVVRNTTKLLVVLQPTSQDVKIYDGTVLGSDWRTDIAVIKIESKDAEPFPFLTFGDSNQVQVGEPAIIIGNPEHLESTVTMGIISAINRNHCRMSEIEGFLQTDSPLNSGNSGGPLLNRKGEVIGVAAWFLTYSEGLGFAIPSYSAQNIANQIMATGKVYQGFLGVELEYERTPAITRYFDNNQGACIKTVVKGSPAARRGLKIGDRILKVNDYSIRTPESLRNQICVLPPDTKIQLEIERQGEILQLDVALGDEDEIATLFCPITYPLVI
jgi:serine protease Do